MKTPAVSKAKPDTTCQVKVHLSTRQTQTHIARRKRAEAVGRDPLICAVKASHNIGGILMCRSHASQAALAILELEITE